MAIEVIEKSCSTILMELRQGRFTLAELELLHRIFQELVNVTGDKLKHARQKTKSSRIDLDWKER